MADTGQNWLDALTNWLSSLLQPDTAQAGLPEQDGPDSAARRDTIARSAGIEAPALLAADGNDLTPRVSIPGGPDGPITVHDTDYVLPSERSERPIDIAPPTYTTFTVNGDSGQLYAAGGAVIETWPPQVSVFRMEQDGSLGPTLGTMSVRDLDPAGYDARMNDRTVRLEGLGDAREAARGLLAANVGFDQSSEFVAPQANEESTRFLAEKSGLALS